MQRQTHLLQFYSEFPVAGAALNRYGAIQRIYGEYMIHSGEGDQLSLCVRKRVEGVSRAERAQLRGILHNVSELRHTVWIINLLCTTGLISRPIFFRHLSSTCRAG